MILPLTFSKSTKPFIRHSWIEIRVKDFTTPPNIKLIGLTFSYTFWKLPKIFKFSGIGIWYGIAFLFIFNYFNFFYFIFLWWHFGWVPFFYLKCIALLFKQQTSSCFDNKMIMHGFSVCIHGMAGICLKCSPPTQQHKSISYWMIWNKWISVWILG